MTFRCIRYHLIVRHPIFQGVICSQFVKFIINLTRPLRRRAFQLYVVGFPNLRLLWDQTKLFFLHNRRNENRRLSGTDHMSRQRVAPVYRTRNTVELMLTRMEV